MLRTVYALDLKPGMIIKCGFIVLLNAILSEGFQEITFLTGDGTVYTTTVSSMWNYEVFR